MATPVSASPSHISTDHTSPINHVIDTAMLQLQGKVLSIEATAIKGPDNSPYDADHNHTVYLKLKDGQDPEPASIFRLWIDGQPRPERELVEELVAKVKAHLANREALTATSSNLILLDSGAFVFLETDVEVKSASGYLWIDGKIAAIQTDTGAIQPVPTLVLQTYTSFKAWEEGDLVILGAPDDERRADGKEGFVFNRNQTVIRTKKNLENFCRRDPSFDQLPEIGEYILLHRSRTEALQSSNDFGLGCPIL